MARMDWDETGVHVDLVGYKISKNLGQNKKFLLWETDELAL